jgi:hypothetical protein
MDSKVTALERAFQLARSGRMATIDDIKKRLKREGYDERVVTEGGRSLTGQLRGLVRTAGADARTAGMSDARSPLSSRQGSSPVWAETGTGSGEPRKRRE